MNEKIMNIGVAFDLDGVITATAKLHYKAWKHEADKLGMNLTREENDKLRGLNRQKTAKAICQLNNRTLTDEEMDIFCAQKNELYKEYINTLLDDSYILGNMKKTLIDLKNEGIKVAITSSSHNAPTIINKLKLHQYIDAVVDPGSIKNHKPFPDLYLRGAELIGTKPEYTIGVEDAPAGVVGIIKANMISVAVKWTNDVKSFKGADYIVNTSDQLTIDFFKKVIKDKLGGK